MRSVIVVVHPHRQDALLAARDVCFSLHAEGIRPLMSAKHLRALEAATGASPVPIALLGSEQGEGFQGGNDTSSANVQAASVADCELVIVLGGDGTLLKAAERFHRSGIPIVGINLGHIGFLAESEREDLREAVTRVAAGDYTVEKRMALDVTVTTDTKVIHKTWAFNEATVEKGEGSRMIELVTGIDSRPVSTFGCDGVILASPTGSTAYAFSAGGPIVWPDVEALLMVPISAHALFAEPLVISPDSRLAVEFPASQTDTHAVLWCDGRRELDLPPGARVEVERAASPVALVRINTTSFTERLVAKFHLPVQGWRGPKTQGADND